MGTGPSDDILTAVRLGWSLAEVRGRLGIGFDPVRLGIPAATTTVKRPNHALPLSSERSLREQSVEAQKVLEAMAKAADVDLAHGELSDPPDPADTEPASQHLAALVADLADPPPGRTRRAVRSDIFDLFYRWDAAIQDTLACQDFGTSSAYQLGRDLAEVFWMLDARAGPGDASSAAVLLGPGRVGQLTDLLQRLNQEFDPLACQAVSFALDRWKAVVEAGELHLDSAAFVRLADQIRVWRDLMLTGKDPKLYLKPENLLGKADQVRSVVRQFLPEVVLLALGVVVLAGGAALLTSSGATHVLGAAVTVVGAAGITTSGVSAKLEDSAHNLIGQLRLELYRAGIAEVTCLAPALSDEAEKAERAKEAKKANKAGTAPPDPAPTTTPGPATATASLPVP